MKIDSIKTDSGVYSHIFNHRQSSSLPNTQPTDAEITAIRKHIECTPLKPQGKKRLIQDTFERETENDSRLCGSGTQEVSNCKNMFKA